MLGKFVSRIENREAVVSVVGLGYVGLPLAIGFAEAGFRVIGVDVDEAKVADINAGRSPVQDVKARRLQDALLQDRFSATLEFSQVSQSDAVILCVPTPLGPNREPDLSHIKTAIQNVIPHLRPGMLISLESTTYPGTTEEFIVRPLVAEGWHPGEDVFVCFSPERVDPGNRNFKTQNTPKVVGGETSACQTAGVALYKSCIEQVVTVSSTKAAEMTKLMENTFRSINIAFVNEMALLCERMGINIWEVISAAATKPFGFMPFYPGPGIGGHCIPLDPAYLAWKAKENKFFSRFIELAQDVNEGMPRHVTRKVSDALNLWGKAVNGSTVLLLGMTYKPDVDDLRESPALEVYELIAQLGARVLVSDPYILGFKDSQGTNVPSEILTTELLSRSDCVVILTAHSVIDFELVVAESQLIVDTRNAIKVDSPKVVKLGAPLPTLIPQG